MRWSFLWFLWACGAPDDDLDGFSADVDCDDADAGIHPGAVETCDGTDQNCDGAGDLGAVDAALWFGDLDGDGFGDPASPVVACEAPPESAPVAGDCDDADPQAFPDAWSGWIDADGDGWGDDTRPVTACDVPLGTAEIGGDCDDSEDGVHPGAPEVCNGRDDDCAGEADAGALDQQTVFADGDGDGFGDPATGAVGCPGPGAVILDGDCDDGAASVGPLVDEICNGLDDDCDGSVDADALDASPWHPDVDADGYGASGTTLWACQPPPGHLADGSDCDDGGPDTWPGALETCDGDDQDCDGEVDGPSAIGKTAWYVDVDGDGFGDPATVVVACDPPMGAVAFPWDCDDTSAFLHPLQAEICGDGVDDDCDGADASCDGSDPGGVAGLPASVLDADYTFEGPLVSQAGETLAVADFDADGIDDLVVAGPEYYNSPVVGRVWLIYGPLPPSGDLELVADAVFEGNEGGRAGDALGVLGDLDGDGFPELGIGASTAMSTGAFYLQYGSATRFDGVDPLMNAHGIARAGASDNYLGDGGIAALGDLDGDGFDDGSFAEAMDDVAGTSAGVLRLLYGRPARYASIDETSLPSLWGQTNDMLCRGQCAVGTDLDGDGFGDVVVATNQNNGTSRVYLAYGDGLRIGALDAADLPYLAYGDGDTEFGGRTAAVGDLDGDGLAEVAVGDFTEDSYTSNGGKAWVIAGDAARVVGVADLTSTARAEISGLQSSGQLGSAIAGIADVDGDSLGELAVGASYTDGFQPQSGVVAIFPAPFGQLRLEDAVHVIDRGVGGEYFGASLVVGDFDGDGDGDLAVGSDGFGANGGRVSVFSSGF